MQPVPQDPSQDRSYDPAAEVVRLCQDLIGIDTSNYGTDDGPGERKAAEYVECAKKALYAFPPSDSRDALMFLPDFVISRDR